MKIGTASDQGPFSEIKSDPSCFDNAPELGPYLLSVSAGLGGGHWQALRSVAGMVGVITAVLVGSTAALAAILMGGEERQS